MPDSTRRAFRDAAVGIAAMLLLGAGAGAGAAAVAVAQIAATEPPAYGYQVGDIAERRLRIVQPRGARLDPQSLPVPNRQGGAVELSAIARDGADDAAAQTIVLRYQVMRSPEVPTVFELPSIRLRVLLPQGPGAREATLFVGAHPLMVSPIAPAVPPERAGLGPMQPDLPPPLPAFAPIRARAQGWALLAMLALGALAWRHLLAPRWLRRRLPFARAWREIRGALPGADAQALAQATRRLHQALNDDAGQVLLAPDLAGWLARRPRFADQAGALQDFLARSDRRFFAPEAPAARADAEAAADAAALRALAQALARREVQP